MVLTFSVSVSACSVHRRGKSSVTFSWDRLRLERERTHLDRTESIFRSPDEVVAEVIRAERPGGAQGGRVEVENRISAWGRHYWLLEHSEVERIGQGKESVT